MANPNYRETVTFYHREGKAWQKAVYRGCSWRVTVAEAVSGEGASLANIYRVRIPLSEAGAGFRIATGDICILGECPDEITGRSPNTSAEVLLANKPDAFKVEAFSDNTRHMVDRHWKLSGSLKGNYG